MLWNVKWWAWLKLKQSIAFCACIIILGVFTWNSLVHVSGQMVVLFAVTNERKRMWCQYMSKYGMQFCFMNYLRCLADLLTAYLHTYKQLMIWYFLKNRECTLNHYDFKRKMFLLPPHIFCYLLWFYFIHYFVIVDEFDNFVWDTDFMNC